MEDRTIIETLLHKLKLALDMGWATWWAVVLGFTITGSNSETRHLPGTPSTSISFFPYSF